MTYLCNFKLNVANSNVNPIGELLLSTKSPHSNSMYPKPTCTADADTDAILYLLDLDTDGDNVRTLTKPVLIISLV